MLFKVSSYMTDFCVFCRLPNSFSAVLNKCINSLDICKTGSDGEYFTVVSQFIDDFTC